MVPRNSERWWQWWWWRWWWLRWWVLTAMLMRPGVDERRGWWSLRVQRTIVTVVIVSVIVLIMGVIIETYYESPSDWSSKLSPIARSRRIHATPCEATHHSVTLAARVPASQPTAIFRSITIAVCADAAQHHSYEYRRSPPNNICADTEQKISPWADRGSSVYIEVVSVWVSVGTVLYAIDVELDSLDPDIRRFCF